MVIAAVFIVVLIGFTYLLRIQMDSAVRAQQSTADALQALFGDTLTMRLREAGLSDALDAVLRRAPIDRTSDPLTIALHLRRLGELAWERSTLADTESRFNEALGLIDAAIAGGRDTATLAERAQLLKGLGDVERERGRISAAETRYAEAVEIWDEIAASNEAEHVLSAVEARLALGAIRERTGDVTGAETEYAAAGQQALSVLTSVYERSAINPSGSFELGRAMQVYADAALSLARVWENLEELRGARALAAGLLRLRPLSAPARVQLGTASAILAAVSAEGQPEAARSLFIESGAQFRELAQFDPRNLRMRRELVAVQLLTSDAVARCAEQNACRPLLRDGELETAEATALDAIGRFRQLSKADAGNTSLLDDIAWGLEAQATLGRARLMERPTAPAADRLSFLSDALRMIDEAVALKQRALVDPADLDLRSGLILLVVRRAQLLADGGRLTDSMQTFDEAMQMAEQLPQGTTASLLRRNVLQAQAEVLTLAEKTSQAAALHEQVEALNTAIGEPWRGRRLNALALNGEGVAIVERTNKLPGAAAAPEFQAASKKYLEAIAQYPFHPVFWDNVRAGCRGAATALESAPDAVAKADERETALRCALTGAWLAWILSDVPPGPAADEDVAARRRRLRMLYEDRRGLAIHLRNGDRQRVEEALALAEQGAEEAEEHAQQEAQSPEAMFLVADAYFGLAMLREEAKADGWEPAFRTAIIHGERLRNRQPRNAERHRWLGTVHAELASRLETARRAAVDVAAERAKGLRRCEDALRLAGSDKERADAQACVDIVRR